MREDTQEYEQIEERTTGHTLSELLHYPEVELDFEYDYVKSAMRYCSVQQIYQTEFEANFKKVGEGEYIT